MSNDERALLAAVAAAPADDTPRLVYADWLDDHGRAVRAEFIRLQCRIAQIETQPRHVVNLFAGLWQRQQEILDSKPDDLFGPLSTLPADVRLESIRGFVSLVSLTAVDFVRYADQLADVRPRPAISVLDAADHPVFLASPRLDIITHLRVYGETIQNGMYVTPSAEELVPALARMTRLESVDLSHCFMVIDLDGAQQPWPLVSLRPGDLPALVDLNLSFTGLTDAGVVGLLDTHLPRQLKSLVLGRNPIGDQGAIELADRWPRTSPLESLNLRFTNIGEPGQKALLARFGGKVDLF